MEKWPQDVKHGLQETNGMYTAWMDGEMQPLKAMKMKRMSAKDKVRHSLLIINY